MQLAEQIETPVKERPMLFSAPMVRALLAGTKTQTRRIINPERVLSAAQKRIGFTFSMDHAFRDCPASRSAQRLCVPVRHPNEGPGAWEDCPMNRVYPPYGDPGERLWVRESWRPCCRDGTCIRYGVPVYRADPNESGPWKPSIHMPRWASRITLELTEVRVERVQDISDSDALAEGIDGLTLGQPPRLDFASLWNQINGPGSWDANPWVWVLSFKRVTPCMAMGKGNTP